jgi:hypothetical protein
MCFSANTFRVQEAPITTLYVGLFALTIDSSLYRFKLE